MACILNQTLNILKTCHNPKKVILSIWLIGMEYSIMNYFQRTSTAPNSTNWEKTIFHQNNDSVLIYLAIRQKLSV